MLRSLVCLVVLSGIAVHAQLPSLCTVSVDVVLADKRQPWRGLGSNLKELPMKVRPESP